MTCLAVLGPCAIARAELAIHRGDTYSLPNDYARLYDETTGNQTASLSLFSTVGNPNGYYLQSLDYDATTGNLSGVVRAASLSYTARVLSWNSSGALLSDVPLNGHPTSSPGYGMDMSVHNGLIAVHSRDSLVLTSDYARLYSATTGNQIASLSYSGTAGNPSGYYLQSLDFDATTGSLFGLVRAASLSYTARVLRWSPSGALLSDIPLSGYPTDGYDYGMDMSVHNGIVAVHARDTLGLTGDYARLYSATTGSQIASLSFTGTAGSPGGYYLQSLDFDATSGDLFGVVRAASLGSTARVLRWSPSGALLSDVPLSGYPTDSYGYGMDMAVLTVAPEPSSIALAAFALVALGWGWRRR